jgi:putative ATP-dependent endonuclease of the OLD family
LDNLVLAYSTEDCPLAIGGDGRKNQIFFATWIAKQTIQEAADHVTFYAIEEPEAHLHPHQQRKLSSYIVDNFSGQVFITTHSPQIASKIHK